MKAQQPNDPELYELIEQALQSRKLDKDYQSLEQQIRCLRLRANTQQDDAESEQMLYQEKNMLL